MLDGQVQELKLEKARLVDENKALQKSKTILEKVYALKEEQVQVLQGANGVRHQLAAELRAAGLYVRCAMIRCSANVLQHPGVQASVTLPDPAAVFATDTTVLLAPRSMFVIC